MLGEGVARSVRGEETADAFVIRCSAAFRRPTPPRRLRYELGTLFLLDGELGKMAAVLIALNPHGKALARVLEWRGTEPLSACMPPDLVATTG